MKKLGLSLLCASVISSCSTVQGTLSKVGKTQATIANSSWILAENVKGKTPTMVIENNKITGTAPCNRYFGELSVDAASGTFSAKNIGATRMSCDALSDENNYLNTLQQANKYVVNGTTLELYKDQILLLKFNRQ